MLVRAKFYEAKRTGEAHASRGRLVLYLDRRALWDGDSVWVVNQDGRAELRKVELGTQQREGYQKVRSGLRSGEQVILPPHDGLSEGGRVEITKKD
jgi:multidrug efflux pump subunit AcrA (membrane-fusion protein)